jgi:hypothetical protein
VVFDPVRGEFTIPVEEKGTFSLSAPESVERIWTLCALERTGYVPANGMAADIAVTIGKEQDKPFWLVRHNGTERRCGNIRELVDSIALHGKKGDSS